MKPEEALKYFETLIVGCMANGAFKKFEDLDSYRCAYDVLKEFVDNGSISNELGAYKPI